MRRSRVAAVILTAGITFGSLACEAEQDGSLQMALYRRFHPSAIEIQDSARRGMVVRQGKILTLMADGVSARPFRVASAGPTAPIVHVMEFARAEVTVDGRVHSETGGLAVPKGTRMVVLDVRVAGDRVHLLVHTADPLPIASRGAPTYGCTEFVFPIPQSVAQGGDPEPLVQLIERSLEWSPELRECASDDPQLCIEP